MQTESRSALMDQEGDGTFQTYHLKTRCDGSIEGETETNDPEDRGEAGVSESWSVRYRDFESMKKATGLSHYGCMGCKVTVYLDGVRI